MPDYFVALLHKKLIADGAPLPSRARGSDPGVLAWAHCPSRLYSSSSRLVIVFANPLNETVNMSVDAQSGSDTDGVADGVEAQPACAEEFFLTAAGEDGVLSAMASLNGGEPLALGSGDGRPPALEGKRRPIDSENTVQLPRESYGFVVYEGPPLSACAVKSDDAMAWRAERGASSPARELGWWLHVDRRFEATLRVMASEPELFTSVSVFHSNYSIAADGSLAVPSAASVSSWLAPLRRALPKAKVSVVLGLGHPEGESDPFPAAAGNADFAPSVAKALSRRGLDGVNRTQAAIFATVSEISNKLLRHAVDWENGRNVRNATQLLSSVIGALSRELAPTGRTVTLCVASGWLPYLGESAWPAYEEAGINRLMTMSTYAAALRKP